MSEPELWSELGNRLSAQTGDVKPFVAYDGEGYEDKYILLANSLGEYIYNREGLSSEECLDFLHRKLDGNPYRVFFSMNYDVNHITKDLSNDELIQLNRLGFVNWKGFRLEVFPGKMFRVGGFTYFDVFPFFHRSFVKVLRQFLDVDDEIVNAGKQARGTFETWSEGDLVEYNARELRYLVEIMEKFRSTLIRTGTHLRQWHGPGAIAKAWYLKHDVPQPEPRMSSAAETALDFAYYGGRFEQLAIGNIQPVYEYDVRSAYPAVIATLPEFTSWRHTKQYEPDNPYSVWRVTFDFRTFESEPEDEVGWVERAKNGQWTRREPLFEAWHDDYMRRLAMPLPLPMRRKDGRICFPLSGAGWYWQREVQEALEHLPNSDRFEIHDGFVARTEGSPFRWVADVYDQRMALKARGDLAEYALKLGLNSLYGKMAQQVGTAPWYSLSWAGYVTSAVRAQVYHAAMSIDPADFIGFATDAVFARTKLDVPVSARMGDWEELSFESGLFFQPGVYRLSSGSDTLDRTRGMSSSGMIDRLILQLQDRPYETPRLQTPKFITNMMASIAPEAYGPHRCKFVNLEHKLHLFAPYKRLYHFAPAPTKHLAVDYGDLLKKRLGSYPLLHMEQVPFPDDIPANDEATFAFTHSAIGSDEKGGSLEDYADIESDLSIGFDTDGLPVVIDQSK